MRQPFISQSVFSTRPFHYLSTALLCGAALFAASLWSASTPAARAAEPVRVPIEGGEAPKTNFPDGEPKEFAQGPLFPFSLLDFALAGNVDLEGNISYTDLKNNKNLQWFLKAVATADLKQFPTFDVLETDPKTGRQSKVRKDRTSELVFWINAYNAHILNSIAEAYPVSSVDSIKNLDTAKTHVVAGQSYSLAEMRAKIVSFGDPRALFALTTGTSGGFLPAPTALRYEEFNDRLNQAVSLFVNDPRNVSINRLQNEVTVSSQLRDVSDAFKVGGRMKYEGIRMVLAGYTQSRSDRGYFATTQFKINFKEASRMLNDRTSRGSNSTSGK
jgi:hypothetical protein